MAVVDDKLLEGNYDGIREYDNPLPRWWLWLFYFTIIISIIYIPYYHFLGGKLPHELYEEEGIKIAKIREATEIKRKEAERVRQVALAKKRKEQAEAQGVEVDEVAVSTQGSADQLTAMTLEEWGYEGSIEDGAEVFTTHCVSCHGNSGEGLVGPNLTDRYWIHGNNPEDLYKTITVGVIEKGMISWKGVLESDEITNVIAYILSIRFSNPSNPKAPQGESYPN